MTDNAGSTESTTGGQKYDVLPTAEPSLREVLSKYFASEWRMDENTTPIPEMVSDILALLSQHGVVQLDGNQELPQLPDRWNTPEEWTELTSKGSMTTAVDTLLKANFKRVRPLEETK